MQKLSVLKNSEIKSFLDMSALNMTNWVLSDIKTFNGVVPTGSFDISNCTRFRIEVVASGIPSGNIVANFDSDTANNYSHQYISGYSTTLSANRITFSGIRLADNWGATSTTIIEFDKSNKTGSGSLVICAPQQQISEVAVVYSGVTAMNSLVINAGSYTFTGTIKVFKWSDVKISSMASYELVKEYTLINQTLNDTIAIDGETFPDMVIDCKFTASSQVGIAAKLNYDGTAGNYYYADVLNYANSGAGNASYTMSNLSICDGIQAAGAASARLFLKSGSKRVCISSQYREIPGYSLAELCTTCWNNTTSPATALTLFSNASLTGTIKVYRLVTTQLLNQKTNPVQLVLNKDYTNAAVNEVLDFSDCDTIDIECYGLNTTALAANVNILVNGSSNFQRESYYETANTLQGNSITVGPAVALSGYTKQYFKLSINKHTGCAIQHGFMKNAANSRFNWNASYEYLGSDAITTLTINGTSGFTGKLKIYKRY